MNVNLKFVLRAGYLSTSVCYIFVILWLPQVPVSSSLVHRIMAADLCMNERDSELLLHKIDCTETRTTNESNRHELRTEW